MFTSSFLTEVRRKALRRGVWYGALDRVERGILSLAAQVVERVESVVLGVELVKIVSKLNEAMKNRFQRRLESYGLGRALKVVEQALAWGYAATRGWLSDPGLARFLTFLSLNARAT
jgi:hypothetical protein